MVPKRRRTVRQQSAITNGQIELRGVRVHNLKNINLSIPRNKLVVITGVSGSGKSSLAFDTIYAEGQRRYVESLSAYARQFLERMEKPDLDSIHGIGPAMAIEQKTNTKNPRSTVGTSTEIYDYLRLLFARIGRTVCPKCGRPVVRDSVQTVINRLNELPDTTGEGGLKVYVMFPLHSHPGESVDESLDHMKKEGFFRIIVDRRVIDVNHDAVPEGLKKEDIQVLVDRVSFRSASENLRLTDSIETAFASGGGKLSVFLPEVSKTLMFNRNFECAGCTLEFIVPEPRLFSFNSPVGACPECQGFGRAMGIDMSLVVPNPAKSLADGAVQPWTTKKFSDTFRRLESVAEDAGVRLDVPFSQLTPEEMSIVMDGSGRFEGIRGFFRRIEKKSYKIFYRVLLSRYRGFTTCPLCDGSRLRAEAMNIRVGGKRISDIVRMTISEALHFMETIDLPLFERDIAGRILDEIRKRLTFLVEVGIGYLTLDRLSSTLSGGESQRINLATSLGTSLVGAVYVLDEPSVGLHPRDNGKLIAILNALRDLGNTVVVVEHDREMIESSDFVVDLGPGAGELGGEVVYVGPTGRLAESPASVTGPYLDGRRSIPVPSRRRPSSDGVIEVRNAREHNLKGINVSIPLNRFVCITGVSGSGKSTLVYDILYEGLRRKRGESAAKEPACSSITGADMIESIECIDQTPIGRTPRSNPVTYIQVFDHIRTLLARTAAAKVHGFMPGHFSFNVPGGRCEECEGDGVIKVEMQFMADLYLTCDACKGKRYQHDVLDVRWNGKNIDEILHMTVADAISFFGAKAEGRRVVRKLSVLDEVGLGYIRLGQPATSLSGGEAQRVKLAAHLAVSGSAGRTLFLFDEPTTGLHFEDIAKLVRCFTSLIAAGHSVVIIEHNLDVIKCADYIIDLGPEAGDGGGEVVAAGTPEEISLVDRSHTGRYLKPLLRV